MNVDRTRFLVFAAALSAAAVGCTGDEEDATAGGGESNLTGDRSGGSTTYCWNPATEGASSLVQELGFDPVTDYPAAEGFCMHLAWPNGFNPQANDYVAQNGVYEKCQVYARNFVPYTTYVAFAEMKRGISSLSSSEPGLHADEKFSMLYEIDRKIAQDTHVCITDIADRYCHPDDGDCRRIASQLKSEKIALLEACSDEGYNAYTCIEGSPEFRR